MASGNAPPPRSRSRACGHASLPDALALSGRSLLRAARGSGASTAPPALRKSAIERGRSHIRARSAWRALLRNRPCKDYAGLVSHAAHREAGRRGTSVPIQIAVRGVIGVLVAPVVITATKPEVSAAMKVIAAEVAAHLGMLTRKAATESRATTGEMASAEPAAHAGAAAEPAHVRAAAEPAHASAVEPAHASAAEPAHVSATHVAATEPAAHM